MSDAKNAEARAESGDLSDESLESVSGGLSLYGTNPDGLTQPTMPLPKRFVEPLPGEETLAIVIE